MYAYSTKETFLTKYSVFSQLIRDKNDVLRSSTENIVLQTIFKAIAAHISIVILFASYLTENIILTSHVTYQV